MSLMCPHCNSFDTQEIQTASIWNQYCTSCKNVFSKKQGENQTDRRQGDRREVSKTGAVRETLEHKSTKGFPLRFDLVLSNDVGFRRLAEAFGEGFLKYGANNWMNGFDESVLLNHTLKHISDYIAGDKSDDQLAHAIWNLYTLMWMQEKKPELLDVTGAKDPLASVKQSTNSTEETSMNVVSQPTKSPGN